MRRLLLFILICWPLLFSGTICNVVVGGVAAPAGDTCGTDDCTFIWHCEDEVVTNGTPAGCVITDGDGEATLSSATITAGHPRDGTYALHISSSQQYASFTPTNIINPTAGTMEYWVYIDTFLNGAQQVRADGGTDSFFYVSSIGASNDIEFRFRVQHTTNSFSLDTDGVNGVEDTAYRVVIKWAQTGDTNAGIYVYNTNGDLLDSATGSTDYSWNSNAPAFYIGTSPYIAGSMVQDIDGVKVWSAWKD